MPVSEAKERVYGFADGTFATRQRPLKGRFVREGRKSSAPSQNGPGTVAMRLGLNCEELFWQEPIESSYHAQGALLPCAFERIATKPTPDTLI